MKFNWFHLMPYRYLPDNFKAAYPSVWVDIPSSLYDPVKGHWLYHDYLDELEFADRVGFDGICVNEHHQKLLWLQTCRTGSAGLLGCGREEGQGRQSLPCWLCPSGGGV